jgi:ATP-binding cassette subfamily B protein
VLFAVSVFFRKRILRASRLVRKFNSKLTASYNEGIVGVRTSKVFVREAENLRDFDRLADEMQQHSIRSAVLSAVYLPLVLTLASVAIALSLAWGGHQVLVAGLAVGEVVMFMYFAQLFFQPVRGIADGPGLRRACAEPDSGDARGARLRRHRRAAARVRQRRTPGSPAEH